MEPKNKQEKRKLYFRFLFVFIIAILIATIPIYLTMQLVRQENKLTAKELQVLQDKIDFQRNIAVQIDSVNHMFEDYDSPSVDIDKLNADIGILLSDMENSIPADTSWQSIMNINIIQTYLSLKKSKNSIIELQNDLAKSKAARAPAPEPEEEKKRRGLFKR